MTEPSNDFADPSPAIDRPNTANSATNSAPSPQPPALPLDLSQQAAPLQQEIESLQATKALLQKQIAEAQTALARLTQASLNDLEQRKQTLQIAVEQLERRQERIKAEMRTTFAGSSQELAIRLQGFKDYLVGSLQDLATAAEQLQLAPPVEDMQRSRNSVGTDSTRDPAYRESGDRESPRESAGRDMRRSEGRNFDRGEGRRSEGRAEGRSSTSREDRGRDNPGVATPRFAEQSFEDQKKRITKLLDQYRMMPDYYGPPWQLRRTFEPVHADRVSNWLFTQGGRGAVKSMSSRLQNTLVAAAAISVLRSLYGDRLRILVVSNSPERLGEWRRGLQDCLGISRGDFGSDAGVVLFDDPEPLAQRADRLLRQQFMPFIIIDESESVVSLSLLQFPLWLAFAPDPASPALF